MKKFISISLIFLYSFTSVAPFVPVILTAVSKVCWEFSHARTMKKMSPRTNFLVVLNDMAKHNNPKQTNTPQPVSINQSANFILCLIPKFNYFFSLNESLRKFFQYSPDHLALVFGENTTPPPKIF